MSNLVVREAERGTGWRWVATAGGRRKSGREATEPRAHKAGSKALSQLQAMPPRQRSGKRVAPPGERFVVTFSGDSARNREAWEAQARWLLMTPAERLAMAKAAPRVAGPWEYDEVEREWSRDAGSHYACVIAVDGDQLVVRFPQLDIAFVVLRSVDSEAPERFFPEAKVEADSRLQEHYELDGDVHTEYPRATVTLSRARMPRGSCYSDFHDWFLFAMPEIERTCGFLVSVLEGDADTPIDIIEITGAPAEERKGLIRLAIERLFEQWQVDYKRAVRSGRILGPSPWARGA